MKDKSLLTGIFGAIAVNARTVRWMVIGWQAVT